MTEEQQEALDAVDHRMNYLGSALNLTSPFGSLSSPKKKEGLDEVTIRGWKSIEEDYRSLSDAIHALRKTLEETKV